MTRVRSSAYGTLLEDARELVERRRPALGARVTQPLLAVLLLLRVFRLGDPVGIENQQVTVLEIGLGRGVPGLRQ